MGCGGWWGGQPSGQAWEGGAAAAALAAESDAGAAGKWRAGRRRRPPPHRRSLASMLTIPPAGLRLDPDNPQMKQGLEDTMAAAQAAAARAPSFGGMGSLFSSPEVLSRLAANPQVRARAGGLVGCDVAFLMRRQLVARAASPRLLTRRHASLPPPLPPCTPLLPPTTTTTTHTHRHAPCWPSPTSCPCCQTLTATPMPCKGT